MEQQQQHRQTHGGHARHEDLRRAEAVSRATSRWISQGLWLASAGAACACFFVLSTRPAHAAAQPDTGASPYFFVQGADPSIDALPLESTDVQVEIAGPIADVRVTQVYRNRGSRPLEARYVFPGSTRAAVHGMNVRLGERLITAQIREKQQARIDYEAARREGRTSALLEQHRPNVFQMNVANILPGEQVKVELRYTELLVPEAGEYRFVFPTVVGPRYAGAPARAEAPSEAPSATHAARPWTAQPVLPQGKASPSAFTLRAALRTPLGLQEISSSTHAIRVQREAGDTTRAAVELAPGSGSNDRDFVLGFRLAGEQIESGVLLHRGPPGGDNYFLAMVQPPRAVPASRITPRDYVFVVDVSGSMHGFPLDTAKTLLSELIGNLRPSDTFNVMLFSGSNRMLAPRSVPATRANIDRALTTLSRLEGGGGTELMPALRRVYGEAKPADLSRTIVVVTDGYVTVESEAFALVRQQLGQANLFAFGIGSSVNRHLMEGLARAGMGEPFIVTRPDDAKLAALRFRRMIDSPVLTAVKARFEGLQVYDVEPAGLPDVLSERPVLMYGKWRGTPARNAQLLVEGRAAEGAYRQVLPIVAPAAHAQDRQDGQGSALRHLWARHRIAQLSDQEALDGGGAQRDAILKLGLEHSLLTQYTSFLAVDRVVRNPDPAGTVGVDQPSPLPQGVGNLAVGGTPALAGAEVPGTPEPAAWGAMAVTLSMLAMLARRRRRQRAQRFTS
ncbi:MAG: VWA domain-containing protein [Burkholderiaceae bacterium]|nr:VWA domain-containing protein [Burkholderiaceae bacterium]